MKTLNNQNTVVSTCFPYSYLVLLFLSPWLPSFLSLFLPSSIFLCLTVLQMNSSGLSLYALLHPGYVIIWKFLLHLLVCVFKNEHGCLSSSFEDGSYELGLGSRSEKIFFRGHLNEICFAWGWVSPAFFIVRGSSAEKSMACCSSEICQSSLDFPSKLVLYLYFLESMLWNL